jgi:hypothetical protein
MALALVTFVLTSQAAAAASGGRAPGYGGAVRSTRVATDKAEPQAYHQMKLTAADGAPGDGFGGAVGVSGSLAVVGAPDHKVGDNVDQGAAYVFAKSGSSYVQVAELTASDGAADDHFGQAVAVSGSIVVVGAPNHDAGTGAAYVFAESGSSFVQAEELTAADGEASDQFGTSVAISGHQIAIGAPDHQVLGNLDQGVAYVFIKSGSSYVQRAELIASDGASDDHFGCSVAISASTVVVGAFGHVASNGSGGSAYVFAKSGSSWPETAELSAFDGMARDDFGYAVAISGSTIVVGDFYQNVEGGEAYVFTKSGSSWSSTGSLSDPVHADNQQFGEAIGVSGARIVVGAQLQTVGSNVAEGEAFVFPGPDSASTATLSLGKGHAYDYFSNSVAISGAKVVVGVPGENKNQGAAYVYTL